MSAAAPTRTVSRVKQCVESLQHLCELLRTTTQPDLGLSYEDGAGQLGRLRIWAGNIGAFQEAHIPTSLEYRLRDAPKLILRISQLLENISESISDLSEIVTGERPNRLGDALDGEGGASEGQDGDDLFPPGEHQDPERTSEARELYESINESISALFKLSMLIKNATPRDRYAKAATAASDPFDDAYDTAHVVHKHPKISTKENQWLALRLGKAITARRQYLRYCRDHRNKLSADYTAVRPPDMPGDNSRLSHHVILQDDLPGQLDGDRAATIRKKPASTLAFTTASTLMAADVDLDKASSIGRSQMSEATSMADDVENQLHILEIEKASKGMYPFECPYCWNIVRIRRQRPWKRHVLQDLKPYVCTFEGCDVKMYNDRHAWFAHELDKHRGDYHCHFCTEMTFSDVSAFERHIRRIHTEQVTQAQLPAIVNVSRQPISRVPAKDCPLCDEWAEALIRANPQAKKEEAITVTTNQFRQHLGNHLEQLALFAIPRGVETEALDGGSDAADAGIVDEHDSASKFIPASTASIVSKPKNDPVLHNAAYQGLDLEVLQLLHENENVNSNGETWGSALHAATRAGNVQMVELLIEHGADMKAIGTWGTVLQSACRAGWKDVVLALLDKGADVNFESYSLTEKRYFTALHCAAFAGHESIVEMLLKAGAEINTGYDDPKKVTSLHLAASEGHFAVVKMLLENGALVANAGEDEAQETDVEVAASGGFEEVVELFLHFGASVRNAMQHAAFGGHEVVVRRLLDFGADINARTQRRGATPLDRASSAGKVGIVRLLINRGANVNCQDSDRDTPLHFAAGNGYVFVAKLLIEHGAVVAARNLRDKTPLTLSVQGGHVGMARYLLYERDQRLENKTDLSSQLEWACRSGIEEMVHLLLDSSSFLEDDATTTHQPQIILAAAKSERGNLLRILALRGFDLNSRNELKETALQLAASQAHFVAVERLLEADADANITGPRGNALCYAAASGNAEIVNLLLKQGAIVGPTTFQAAGGQEHIIQLLRSAPLYKRDVKSPTYMKVHKDHVSLETLHHFDLPWEYDANDNKYIIIRQQLDNKDMDRLFDHSRTLRNAVTSEFLADDSRGLSREKDLVDSEEILPVRRTRSASESRGLRAKNPDAGEPLAARITSQTLEASTPQIIVSNQEGRNNSFQERTVSAPREELPFGFTYSGEPSQRKELIVEIRCLIEDATRNDFAADNYQESFAVIDAMNASSKADLMAPPIAYLLTRRFKEPHPQIQMKALSLMKVLAYNGPAQVQVQLSSEWFAYALARLALSTTTIAVVRQTVIDMLVEWLEREDLLSRNEGAISLVFLQDALDAILTGHLEDKPELEMAPTKFALIDDYDPPPKELPKPAAIDPGLLYNRLQDVTLKNDPFVNWSGKGRHVKIADASELPLIPQESIFKARRYKFNTVRWRSYVLTQKIVTLDERWTRDDAFREVETLELMQHSHIMQVVGSYSLPDRFTLLCHPGTSWTLEQFMALEPRGTTRSSLARFFTCMASAVQHIHSTGLRHGDIRPRACLVASTISRRIPFQVFLTGFDLAHRPRFPSLGEDDDEETEGPDSIESKAQLLSRSGKSGEKGKYAAPEKNKGIEADIFSLGCTFVEMMATVPKDASHRKGLDHILRNTISHQEAASNHVPYRLRLPEVTQLIGDLSSETLVTDSDIGWKLTPASQGGSALQSMVVRMLSVNAAERPAAADIVEGLLGTLICCEAREADFEPDWFSENRAVRDTALSKAEAEPSGIEASGSALATQSDEKPGKAAT